MTRILVSLMLFLATTLAFAPDRALAAYPCPGGPGPGETQVGVGGGSHGVAAVPMCESSGAGGAAPTYSAPSYTYGSIAWHADASDVWMEGGYDGSEIADKAALDACNRAMGGGCTSIGEWRNSKMMILRDRSGTLWTAWNDGKKGHKEPLAECSAKQLLPCEVLGTFSSGKGRHKPKGNTLRKLYAAAAWVQGTEGFDERLYIASGHRTAEQAMATATEACKQTTKRACEVLAVAGNGVIQAYKMGDHDYTATAETSVKRAQQAAKANCQKRQQPCSLQIGYDSRKSGQFVHDFRQGDKPS